MIASPILEQHARAVIMHLEGSAAVTQRTSEVCTEAIMAAAGLIAESFRAGGNLLLCGNGGSAADCQHLAAEFTSRLSADFPRPGLPALALTTDTSFLTAYANDFDFDGVFARQVQTLGKPGDVFLGISTSGRSKNVVQAAQLAKQMGMRVIALTSALVVPPSGGCVGVPPSGGLVLPPEGGTQASPAETGTTNSGRMPLLRWADVAICIPSHNTQHIQEAHLAVEHILCHLVERSLFGDDLTLASPHASCYFEGP